MPKDVKKGSPLSDLLLISSYMCFVQVELVCIKAVEAPRTSLATNLQVKGMASTSTAEAGSGFRKMNAENGFKDNGTLKMIMSDELDQVRLRVLF